MRPLSLSGANSVVFKARVMYVALTAGTGRQVEWEGPVVAVKGLVTPISLPPGESSSHFHERMLKEQAADYQVLLGLPSHPNIVELVHHFEAPALLLRPFVGTHLLPFLSISKTTCVVCLPVATSISL